METLLIAYMYSGHSKLLWHEQTTHLSKEVFIRNTLKLFITCNDRNHPPQNVLVHGEM